MPKRYMGKKQNLLSLAKESEKEQPRKTENF